MRSEIAARFVYCMAGEMEQAWFRVTRVFLLSLFASGLSGENAWVLRLI